MKPKIVIAGSSNTDMVIQTTSLPLPGETVLGGNFFMNAGGKGANQAVAAARLGGDITFVAKVGNDVFGKEALDGFKKENINTMYVFVDDKNASGIALITVDTRGENCIAVASGANAALCVDEIGKAESAIVDADIVLVQLETPVATVEKFLQTAFGKGIKTVLNPAPALALTDNIYQKIFLITPNEKEASVLSGTAVCNEDSAKKAAQYFVEKGVQQVIITLGEKGALLYSDRNSFLIPSPKVKAVDTTAAGDVFNGALVVAIGEGKCIEDAVLFANASAALSVTRLGAQASAPYRWEVEDFIKQQIR